MSLLSRQPEDVEHRRDRHAAVLLDADRHDWTGERYTGCMQSAPKTNSNLRTGTSVLQFGEEPTRFRLQRAAEQ